MKKTVRCYSINFVQKITVSYEDAKKCENAVWDMH